jgi:hypothetical protein
MSKSIMLFPRVLYFRIYSNVEYVSFLCLLFSCMCKKVCGNFVVQLHIIDSISKFLNFIPMFFCIHLAFQIYFSSVSDYSGESEGIQFVAVLG